MLNAVASLIDNIDEIRNRTEKGMQVLIEGLLLAGITIMIVGHTRAVASVEHNVGHFVEMKMLERYGKAPSHGATVGAATLMVYPAFKRFANEDISGIDPKKRFPMPVEERRAFMRDTWGVEGGETIMAENPGDFLTTEELRRRVRRAKERFGDIKKIIDGMPAYDEIYAAMERLGAKMTLAELGVDPDVVNTAMHCAKDYRTRYSLFKTLDELGLLETYIADYPMTR